MTPTERADALLRWWGISPEKQWPGCPWDEMRGNIIAAITEAVQQERRACAASLWDDLPEMERKHLRMHHRDEMEWRKGAAAAIEAREDS